MFYELVFLVRSDVSNTELEKITDGFRSVVVNGGGDVLKVEYWGLRNLTYNILRYKKAYYVFFIVNVHHSVIADIEKKMKISDVVIRFLILKVKSVDMNNSPIIEQSDSTESANQLS